MLGTKNAPIHNIIRMKSTYFIMDIFVKGKPWE